MPLGPNQFVSALWGMVSDPDSDDMIKWSDDGTAVVIETAGVMSLAAKYGFRFTKPASFFRQLNFYGFRSGETDQRTGTRVLVNGNFTRDNEAEALTITRGKSPPKTSAALTRRPTKPRAAATEAGNKKQNEKEQEQENEKQEETTTHEEEQEKARPAVVARTRGARARASSTLALATVRGKYTDSGRRVKPIRRLVPSTSTRKTYGEAASEASSAIDLIELSASNAPGSCRDVALVTPMKEDGLKKQLQQRRQRNESDQAGALAPAKKRKPEPQSNPAFKTPARTDPRFVAARAPTPSRAAKTKAQAKIEHAARVMLASDREIEAAHAAQANTKCVTPDMPASDPDADFDRVSTGACYSPTEREVLAMWDRGGPAKYEVKFRDAPCNQMRIKIRVRHNCDQAGETNCALGGVTNVRDESGNDLSEHLRDSNLMLQADDEEDDEELKRLNIFMHGTMGTAHLRVPVGHTTTAEIASSPVHDAGSTKSVQSDDALAPIAFGGSSNPPVRGPMAPQDVSALRDTLGLGEQA